MQLHRLIGTDPPCTPRRRDGRHGTHRSTTRVPTPRAQGAVGGLTRRGADKAAGTLVQSHLGGLTRTLGAGARVAAAWLVASCITLGLASLATAAQAEVLVSNINQTRISAGFVVGVGGLVDAAQGFTTGTSATGYDLTSVDIYIHSAPTNSAGVTATIYTSSSGAPGTSLHTLATPATITTGANTFTAPSAAFLASNTTYFVVVEYSGTGTQFKLSQTTSDIEGSKATGWSIANERLWTNDNTNWPSQDNAHLITVNGSNAPAEATITAIQITSDPGEDDTYGIGDDIDVTVTFDTDITLNTSGGDPELELNVGGTGKGAECAAHATALDSLVCSYEVEENDADANGISIGANNLTLEGGAITFGSGTRPANLDHEALPTNPGHKVNGDPTVPTITGVAFTSTPSYSSDTYGLGESIEISVTFSLPVWATGNVQASIRMPDWRGARVHAGNGTRTLRFRQTVQAGETDTNGVSLDVNFLAGSGVVANGVQGGGSIKSSAGVDARLNHARVPSTGGASNHKVDGSMTSSMTTPNAPTNIAAIADGADEIRITWTPPTWPGTSTITEYQVETGASDTGPWTRLAPNPTGTSFDHTGLDAATTYHYRVRAVNSSGNGAWSGTTSATTTADLVCGRTSAIADAIVAATPAATCAKVTATQLSEVTSLDASGSAIAGLSVGDFAGLTGLKALDLSGNQITTLLRNLFTDLSSLTSLDLSGNDIEGVLTGSFAGLTSVVTLDVSGNDFNTLSSAILSPLSALKYLDASGGTLDRVGESALDGVFSNLALTGLELGANGWSELPAGILEDLTGLTTLDLTGNTVDPLPVIVDLERVERAKFKALIAAGAPFAAALPVTIVDGTLDGTPVTVNVAAGGTESADRTVTVSATRTGAVTVTLGTLPALPSGHSGYVLKASDDLPLTVVAEAAVVTIEGESGQIVANAWDRADFTLTRTPAGGAIDVEVEVTESDTFVIAGSLGTQTVPFADGDATATLSLQLKRIPSGDGTITATVQAGDDNTVGTPASATVNVVKINPAMDVVFRDDTITVEEGNNVIVHVVATTAAGVDRPSMDAPSGVTVSTRKAEADPDDGDYTTVSAEFFFAHEDFTQNADGRWVATITAEVTTHDDTEYEGTEEFSAKLEGTAGLTGTVTINGTLAPREDDVAILLTDNDPPPPPPSTGDLIRVVGVTPTDMFMEWYDGDLATDDEVTGYQIERSLTGADPWTVVTDFEEHTPCARDHCAYDRDLTPDTTYFYRFSTRNEHGLSEPSPPRSGRTHKAARGVCARTPEIRDWIVAEVPNFDHCADITQTHLEDISARLDLGNQGLTELRPGDFDGLSKITRLDLDDNALTTLPAGLFDDLVSIEVLILVGNNLETLPDGIFRNLRERLTNLNLADNNFDTLPGGLFAGLDIFALDLSGNPFTTLPDNVFAGVRRIDSIDFSPGNLDSLPSGIFRPLGPTRSFQLYLGSNDLQDLPAGLFERVRAALTIWNNPGTVFQVEIGLESDNDGTFRIAIPVGVLLGLDVEVTATNGTIDGASTKTIALKAGTVETAPIRVQRSPGTTGPITVTLGPITQPVNEEHGGYEYALASVSTIQVAPVATTPGTPTELTARPDGPNEIELAWVPPEPDPTASVTGYRIEVSTDTQTWTNAVADTATTAPTYMHTGRMGGTTYHYRVRAINVAGTGDASNVASAMTTELTGVCERTPAVVIEIERATATDCSLISPYQLARINKIDLSDHDPATLANGDFDGLSGLASLNLGQGLTSLPADLLRGLASLDKFTASGGTLASVPAGLFAKRTTLTKIDLSDNPLTALPDRIFEGIGRLATLDLTPSGTATTLPLAATLKYVEEGVFRIAVPTGAPYNMRMSTFVLNGRRAGNEPFVEIPAGRTQSEPIRIVRNDETSAPVIVRLTSAGIRPALHTGYEFSLGPSNGIQVLAGEGASVSEVKLPITRGPFGIDDDIRIDVLFDKEVTVDTSGGSPTIELDVGGTRKTATYETGSGTAKLEFKYTVKPTDEDTDGVSVPANTLKLNGATVRSGTYAADIEHDALETVATATVDGIAPTLIAKTVDGALVTLTYDEAVRQDGTGGAPRFEYNIDNDPTFTQVCDQYYNGPTIQLTLCAAATASERVGLVYQELAQYQSVSDLAGNAAPGINTGLENITAATAATITTVAITSDPNDDGRPVDDTTYAIGDTVEVTVTFDATVTVNTSGGTPELELDFGGEPVRAAYTSGTLTELIFNYTVAEGDEDTDGIAIGADKLTLNGGIITGSNAKNADLTHTVLAANAAHKVDGVRPKLTLCESADDGNTITCATSETIVSTLTRYQLLEGGRLSAYNIDSALTLAGVAVRVTLGRALAYGETLDVKIAADTITDAAGNVNTAAILPLIDGVTEPVAYLTDVEIAAGSAQNGHYVTNDVVSATARFNKTVTVDDSAGTPTLGLTFGGPARTGDRTATYASGSGTTGLVFTYTIVAEDESSSHGIGTQLDPIALNGATITRESTAVQLERLARDGNGTRRVNYAPPVLSSAATASDGMSIVLTFDQALRTSTSLPNSQFSVTADGEPASLSTTLPTISGTTVTLSLTDTLIAANKVTVTYTDASTRDDSVGIQDTLGNDAESFTTTMVSNTVAADPPDAPTGLGATTTTARTVKLDWTAPTDTGAGDITGYQIEVSTDSASNWTVLEADTGSDSTTYTDEGLTPETRYDYRVSAINADGVGAASSSINTTTEAVVTISSIAITSDPDTGGNTDDDDYYQGIKEPGSQQQDIEITVTFSAAVDVQTPTATRGIALEIAGQTKIAAYKSGTGTAAIVFKYTVEPGLEDRDGVSFPANPLRGHGIVTKDEGAGFEVDGSHAAIANDAGHKVDSIRPKLLYLEVSSDNETFSAGFNEAVTFSGVSVGYVLTNGELLTPVNVATADQRQTATTIEYDNPNPINPGNRFYTTMAVLDAAQNTPKPVITDQIPTSTATVPSTPQNFAALPGNGRVSLTWDAPESDGGRTIDSYEYRYREAVDPLETANAWGDWTAINDSGPTGANRTHYRVMDLTNGKVYEFQLQARNAIGTSNVAGAAAMPREPGAVRASLAISPASPVAENAGTVAVTVIVANNAPVPMEAPVTLTVATADGTATAGEDYTALSQALTFAITDFALVTAGSHYEASKEATFAITDDIVDEGDDETFTIGLEATGTSADSVNPAPDLTVTITENDEAPGAPALSAEPGDAEVTLKWTAGSAGTATIAGYDYRVSDSTGAPYTWNPDWTAIAGGADATSVTVNMHAGAALVNGTAYTFEVRALERGRGRGSAGLDQARRGVRADEGDSGRHHRGGVAERVRGRDDDAPRGHHRAGHDGGEHSGAEERGLRGTVGADRARLERQLYRGHTGRHLCGTDSARRAEPLRELLHEQDAARGSVLGPDGAETAVPRELESEQPTGRIVLGAHCT